MARSVLRTLLAPVVFVLAASALVAPSAQADPPATELPGDEPLPGYTISNPPVAPLEIDGDKTTVKQGVHEHAAYILEVPPGWNGELVMWAHGYRGDSTVLSPETPGFAMRRTFLEQGYAWAASSYATNGYDVASGVESTHTLARYADRVLPRPSSRTYITGVSMGGHVIGRSLEEYPRQYDGALPMCGVLGDHQLFDYLLDYNLVAQTLAGRDAYPVPADYQSVQVPAIKDALGLTNLTPGGPDTVNELGDQLRKVTINRSGGPRPGDEAAFASWKDFLFTLAWPDDGRSLAFNPSRLATNLGTYYDPNAPVDLNASVERVAPADVKSRLSRGLTAAPKIIGKPRVPVLSLHSLGDLFVPFSMEQAYAKRVAAHGRSDLLVQRAIRSTGHCEFSPAEATSAWNDLVQWVEAGGAKARQQARPDGDDVLTPSTVAAEDYGCAFSDKFAYGTGSRPLFTACE